MDTRGESVLIGQAAQQGGQLLVLLGGEPLADLLFMGRAGAAELG
jgi:hypothetical protein